jgi:hypothetical protein
LTLIWCYSDLNIVPYYACIKPCLMQNSTNTTVNQRHIVAKDWYLLMGVHNVSAFHPFIFQKSGKSTIIRNLAVPQKNEVSFSWLYSSWIYNDLCNQCLLPLKLRVRIPHVARCTQYMTLCVKVCQWPIR